MYRLKRYSCLLCLALFVFSGVAFAQETSPMDFGFDLGVGVESFNEPDGTSVAWQTLSLLPDFAFGKFGIGLDLTLHFNFTGGEDNAIEIRKADWVPTGDVTFLELYLPKFRYVRWGFRGDPLYIKLGSIDDATLGNGFIMGNYANTLFLPETRIFGLNFDLDGNLFNFPYVGFQSFVGNLASPDVIGGRLFVRPLAWLTMPILPHLEIGYSVVGDMDPFRYTEDPTVYGYASGNGQSIVVHGADFRLPLIANDIISLATFGDVVFEGSHAGGMLGAGARLFKVLPIMAQIRILGTNFIPVYFGATYDIYRALYYKVANAETEVVPSTIGWFASTGFAFFEDQLSLSLSMDGPIVKPLPNDLDNWVNWPHMRLIFLVGKDLLQSFDFSFWYDKTNIQAPADLIDFENNTVIGAAINYYSGPAVLTLEWDIRYKPMETPSWETTAKLKSSISLF